MCARVCACALHPLMLAAFWTLSHGMTRPRQPKQANHYKMGGKRQKSRVCVFKKEAKKFS